MPPKTRTFWNNAGELHFFTYSCNKRRPLLNESLICLRKLEAIRFVQRNFRVRVLGYVLMPEHVHILLQPGPESPDMEHISGALKQPVSHWFHTQLMASGRYALIWELSDEQGFHLWLPGGGYDRNIREPASIPALLAYMHENPVRRGLTERAVDYRWSSARFWADQTDFDLEMDEIF